MKKQNTFLKLYMKDILLSKNEILFVAIALLASFVVPMFITTLTSLKETINHFRVLLAVSSGVSYSLIFLWYIYSSLSTVSKEWKHRTGYLIMTLPVKTSKIILSKLTSRLSLVNVLIFVNTVFLVLASSIYGIINISYLKGLFGNLWEIVLDLIACFIYLNIFGFLAFSIANLSNIISKFFIKYRKMLTALISIIVMWLFFRISTVFGVLFKAIGFPDIKGMTFDSGFSTNISGFAGMLIFGVLAFILSVYIFDKHIEVD
jgi:hypothetical protein